MSDQIDDGGPAFPQLERSEIYEAKDGGQNITHYCTDGISLRDQFAGKALQGLIANNYCAPVHDMDPDTAEEVGRYAYVLADAMLAARKRKP